jgi:acyl transferase domain-containing protein
MMPQADDLDSFWQHLKNQQSLITPLPEQRGVWQADHLHPNTDKPYSRWGGFINDIDLFDAHFFSTSPREAELIDPQQRLFLETVWHTIEDAGYSPDTLSSHKTGLFVGVSCYDYEQQ